MDAPWVQSLLAQYHWQYSLMALIGIIVMTHVIRWLGVQLVPAFAQSAKINKEAYARKMENPRYAENQRWNAKWGKVDMLVIFGLIMPFCLTLEPQPWWQVLRDMFVILMVYDFFYYLVHRFLFHDGGFGPGPLLWVHAYHHRQKNPCRNDGSYIHPIEVAMGLGLYAVVTFALSRFMGNFHVITVITTWYAFSEINQHNHDLWSDKYPIKYLNTMSVMHHNHHARFTGGNFATISLLYDWIGGTLDYGQGWTRKALAPDPKEMQET